MHDLTEARPTTQTVTAKDVYELGYEQGREAERQAILRTLSAEQMIHDDRTADVIWTICKVINAGAHRLDGQS